MNILILADTNLLSDARIRRHIFTLKEDYNLIVTGIKNPNIDGNIEFIDCSKDPISAEELKKRRKQLRIRITNKEFEEAYWGEAYIQKLYKKLENKKFDMILANDISMVPLAVKLAKKRNIKIVADMHEYAPRQFEDIDEWRVLFKEFNYYLCKKYLPICDKVITVSQGISKEYKKQFNVESSIITNAPEYTDLNIKKTTDKIRMVYHGCSNRSRNLYTLLEIVKSLDDRYSLDLYLIKDNDQEYFDKLVEEIKITPRCHIKEPMQPEEIVKYLHEYDIGIYLLEPKNFNQKYALPNKFFEFAQARLAIAIGPSCEMKKYINKFNCGVISEDFNPKTLAQKLNELTEKEIDNLKINSGIFAKKENFKENKKLLLKIIQNL
ncbi:MULTISPECIES: glycosyltransferase [unclassified Clostridium]|uniref:glycosyltransferase n=1 Tax=unclassified Clostridium TaxID=2614128 RepID=UPI0013FA0BC7|nr:MULTISPECIES: glycosyltransferase [unclassified Clostridium]NFR87444.1 glycosyltransferase family 4 protein [Clostridium botulinum]NFR89388.1 glycosyltransferase family 4 protein [Clostridium botulinum]NFT98973.1 glycosyltransferase family 4 protein [Clostridium botulinum]